MSILKIEEVTKQYSGTLALDRVSLEIPEGKIYGLLGPNGAGKTTLIRIINHITAPDNGKVEFMGHQLTAKDVVHIGYLPEERGLYKKMKVGDQALFFAKLKGLSTKEAYTQLRYWFDKFGISDWWNRKIEELSKGMAQKIQFIITVLHHPKLLIFDEPFSGFDPINANLLKDEILRLRDEGATVIFSTHNMESVEKLCDEITLFNHGHNILSGNVNEIRTRMGKGRYRISFEGDPQKLLSSLGSLVIDAKFNEDPNSDVIKVELQLQPDAPLRHTISLANDAVELVSFDRALPSMNDIFIRTVGESEEAGIPPVFDK